MDPRRLLTLTAAAAVAGCAALPVAGPRGPARAPNAPVLAAAPTTPAPAAPADPLGLPPPVQAGDEAVEDARVGGLRVFAWSPGRIYEVRTAPLRVTTLALAPGETVIAKAAGDTVRWRIGETTAGTGAAARAHVLVKPLEAGLRTNLVLTTDRRTYLVQLSSGSAAEFDFAVAWGDPPEAGGGDDARVFAGPLHAGYRVDSVGEPPAWTPVAVFDDGRQTFIALDPEVAAAQAPALFVGWGEGARLANYRQSGNVLILDQVVDRAELRAGGPEPEVVRLRRAGADR